MKKFTLPEINSFDMNVEDVILASGDQFAVMAPVDQELGVENPSDGSDWI